MSEHIPLHNRLLTNLHVLIREYALIIGKEEKEVKQQIKSELNIESFGDIDDMDIARASAYVQKKIDKHNYGNGEHSGIQADSNIQDE